MNLSAALLELRSTYGRAHQALLAQGLPGEARTLALAERLVEELPPACLGLSATQAVLHHLLGTLPEDRQVSAWRGRLLVHCCIIGVTVNEPLYSALSEMKGPAHECSRASALV